MASSALLAGDGDDLLVVLKCVDHHEPADYNPNKGEDEVTISTADVYSWNFSSILQHRIIKVKAHKNRLIEHSSYFHGLLGGNFSYPDVEVLVQWNQPTFLSLLASLFGSPDDITSENFLSLFQGALYFGMEIIISKCKMWLTNAISVNGDPVVQLIDVINIWEFGSEIVNYLPELCTSYLAKNFMWAISCSSFGDIPHDLLLSIIKHPNLTVDSEKQLCDAVLGWIGVNKEGCSEVICINLLKQIRISLLPVQYMILIGKKTNQSLSMCCHESLCRPMKQPFSCGMDAVGDCDLLNLRIRLTEFTQRVDLSRCPQIKPLILLLSMLPYSFTFKQLLMNHEPITVDSFRVSLEVYPKLTFEAVKEIDISNCPMLDLDVAIECFSKSFPNFRTLKAVNHLEFRTRKLLQMVRRCPLLSDIDLSVDVSPIVPPTQVSNSSSFRSYMSTTLQSNITKLILDGRNDFSDFELESISDTCVSLSYISLKGCKSISDAGISSLICKCLKLNSIVACDTLFGQQSILALSSSNACNLLMLHIGGCKGINMTCFSKLISEAYMLKNLCLRETEVVDNVLFNFFGSSLQVLDVTNTKISAPAVAHVVTRNPNLKCIKARGCTNLLQQETQTKLQNLYFELGESCKLDEISFGWGFSYFSLEMLKPAVALLKSIEVGLGGKLGIHGLKLLPSVCPLLESVLLHFQVICDDVIANMMECLKKLRSFALCYCVGEISSLSFKNIMPNLRKLRLERVTPWMENGDLVSLTQNCTNLSELSLVGCRLLNSESQKIISSGWPSLISIHLEECGHVTSNGVVSLFDCHALEEVLLRHNGCGIQRGFICESVMKLPMLRKISLDICDAKDRDFDIPETPQLDDRHLLSHVKIARCKSPRCAFNLQHVNVGAPIHIETLVLLWDSKQLTRTLVKDRL